MDTLFKYDEAAHMAQVREEGREKGLEEGYWRKSLSQVRKKLAKNLDAAQIADIYEEDEIIIKELISLIKKYPQKTDTELSILFLEKEKIKDEAEIDILSQYDEAAHMAQIWEDGWEEGYALSYSELCGDRIAERKYEALISQIRKLRNSNISNYRIINTMGEDETIIKDLLSLIIAKPSNTDRELAIFYLYRPKTKETSKNRQ